CHRPPRPRSRHRDAGQRGDRPPAARGGNQRLSAEFTAEARRRRASVAEASDSAPPEVLLARPQGVPLCSRAAMSAERERLEREGSAWKLWGPYVAERAWGTVREDYSANGTAWDYFPHDH